MWNNVLCFIKDNAPLWDFLVTIATIAYVLLTFNLLKESITSRKNQNKPNVIADIEVSGFFLKLVIKNLGNNNALDVNISIQPEIKQPLNHIAYLPSGREISNVIKFLSDSTNMEKKYIFEINYKDIYNQQYYQKYEVDISPLLEVRNFKTNEYKDIVEKLDKIEKSLNNITNAIKEIVKKIK